MEQKGQWNEEVITFTMDVEHLLGMLPKYHVDRGAHGEL